jgi:hypothetical protein
MGEFIWHQWSRFVAISACIYLIWAGFWGLFYRKFFWDFIGSPGITVINTNTTIPHGSLMTCILNCGGHNLTPAAKPFAAVIVTVPLIQIFMMLFGIFTVCLEYPIPQMKNLSIQRNFGLKAFLLFIQAFIGILSYQGTNGAVWAFIGAIGYARAAFKGEVREEDKIISGGGRA